MVVAGTDTTTVALQKAPVAAAEVAVTSTPAATVAATTVVATTVAATTVAASEGGRAHEVPLPPPQWCPTVPPAGGAPLRRPHPFPGPPGRREAHGARQWCPHPPQRCQTAGGAPRRRPHPPARGIQHSPAACGAPRRSPHPPRGAPSGAQWQVAGDGPPATRECGRSVILSGVRRPNRGPLLLGAQPAPNRRWAGSAAAAAPHPPRAATSGGGG